MRRVSLLMLVVGILAIPVAGAGWTEEAVSVLLDGDEAHVIRAVELEGDAALDVRDTMDFVGDRDGTVSFEDVSRYERLRSGSSVADNPDCANNFAYVRMDGRTAIRLAAFEERITQGMGEIDGRPLGLTRTYKFQFRTPASHVATASIDLLGLKTPYPYEYSTCDALWGSSYLELAGRDPPMCCDVADGSHDTAATILRIGPLPDGSIERANVFPTVLGPYWDGESFTADRGEDRAIFRSQTIRIPVGGGTGVQGSALDEPVLVGVSVATIGFALWGLSAWLLEPVRYMTWKLFLLVPLFSRLEKDEVLEHDKRGQLYQFIRENPGPSFSDLLRAMELSNGTLVHHLRILEAQEFIKPVRDGFRTRFYVRGPRIVPESYLTRTQQGILDTIQANPGITQKQLSHVLGVPRESVFYHTKRLAALGKVHVERAGKWRKYFVAPGAEGTPAGTR